MIEERADRASLYQKAFLDFITDKVIHKQIDDIVTILENQRKYHPEAKVIIVGNGGSSCASQHIAEDLLGCVKIPTICYDSVGVITALSNDYGYENGIKEWLSVIARPYDVLICISSSGESKNIVNAASWFIEQPQMGELITITGFESRNTLKQMGDVNIHISNYDSYGIHELFAETSLHIVIDLLIERKKKQCVS